jgi:DNA-3-methyladenine glycosylase II
MDRWDGKTYSRILAVGQHAVKVCVTQRSAAGRELQVVLPGSKPDRAERAEILMMLDRLLGLPIDLRPFYLFTRAHARLFRLSQSFRGLKPTRFPSVFEAIVNGIACQQLSLTVGITLLNRLSEAYGLPFGVGETEYAFPQPHRLAAATGSDLRRLGFSSNKSRAMIELASSIAAGRVNVGGLVDVADAEAMSHLLEIRGIGRWTANYVLLRGLGRTNIFPGDDVGARNNLARRLNLRRELDYGGVARILTKWKPYGGLIYFHLLMGSLQRTGYVQL